jgi:L-rhamnose mutarotase
MIRKCFTMQLHRGILPEYQRRHDEIWPELVAVLKSHGVHNYSIFLNPETLQLIGYVEIESEMRWDAIAATPVCRKWWAYMRDLMEVNDDDSPKSVGWVEIFHLD